MFSLILITSATTDTCNSIRSTNLFSPVYIVNHYNRFDKYMRNKWCRTDSGLTDQAGL